VMGIVRCGVTFLDLTYGDHTVHGVILIDGEGPYMPQGVY